MKASLNFKEFREVLPKVENNNDGLGKVVHLDPKEGSMNNEAVPAKVEIEASKIHLNKGNAYLKSEKYDLAIESYQNSI